MRYRRTETLSSRSPISRMQSRRIIADNRDADPDQLESIGESDAHLPYSLQFWLLLCFDVPSLTYSLFIFYHYLFDSKRRRALHNHLILLIITDVSWTLDSFRHSGRVRFPSPSFCMIWWFFDYSLFISQTGILAWVSIERHLLIFRSHLMSTRRKRVLSHYLPAALLVLY